MQNRTTLPDPRCLRISQILQNVPVAGPAILRQALIAVVVITLLVSCNAAPATKKILVAHRGASAYAPEHTLDAYRLALQQGADYVEQDLQVTKDNVLICMHDASLERTTNVEEVFPNRFREVSEGGKEVRKWYVSDFTLAEIKQLDAGSWFAPKHKGAKVPTWQEAIDLVKGKAGLFPELKYPEMYRARGFDMESLFTQALQRNGLAKRGADPKTPVLVQSFSAESLKRLKADYGVELPLILLISPEMRDRWLRPEALKEASAFASGIGPAKGLIDETPQLIEWAHQLNLTVTPYTFRSSNTGRFKNVRDEMAHYLKLGVDAVFTDNPDQFPRGQ